MKIQVELNTKSISNAIRKLKRIEYTVQRTLVPEFVKACCEWIIERAKWYVDNSDIGANVKNDINSHWSYVLTGDAARILNDSDKAVFVEFGVGAMGEAIPHDNAKEAGYNYNVNNHKYWVYPVDSLDDVDMHEGYLSREDTKGRGMIWIITKGSWRVMYAHQAIIDAKESLMHNGELVQIWRRLEARYLR